MLQFFTLIKEIVVDNNEKEHKEEQAVALGYDRGKAPAPQLLAKGKGTVARQIIDMAKANDIPIVDDADLVAILGAVEVDAFIPLEAYGVVAEILSYIYGQTERKDV